MMWTVLPGLAYLIGSIPTGYLVTKCVARGADIRATGSGNVGATNVARVVGKGPGLLVLLLDVGKGLLAVGLVPGWWPGAAPSMLLRLVMGVAVVVGHDYPCFLRLQGGKGIATTLGVLVLLLPPLAGVCVLVWVAVFLWTRYVSLASIAASLALPLGLVILGYPAPTVIVGSCLAWLAIYRHRANIRRLSLGQEPRFTGK